MSAVINCAAYSNGRRIADAKVSDINQILQQKDKFVWIGLHEPDEELLMQAQHQFGLHDLAIEDAHHAHQRPKIELYGDTLFMVMRTAFMNQGHINFGETHFFLGPNFLLTIRHGSTISYGTVRTRCESTPQLLGKGPSFAFYAVMDSIVDQYFPVVEELQEELTRLEEAVFSKKPNRETTEEIYRLKQEVVEVKRVVSPLIDMCNRLIRFDFVHI